MSEGIPDTESAVAIEGTYAHYVLLDEALTDWLLMGTMTVEHDDLELQGYLQLCFDYVVQRYNEIPGDNKRILIESKVDLHYMTNRDDLWGNADIIIMTDSYIDVIDLKYGAGIFVEADSSQTKMYALGAMCAEMKRTRDEAQWVSVRSTIMQPRFPDSDGEIIRYEDYDPDELIEWKDNVLIPAAAATDNPGDPIPGIVQCRFCPVKATCPAAAQVVTDLCNVFEPVTDGAVTSMVPTEVLYNPETIDVAKLLQVHDQIPFIEGYLKAVSTRLRTLIEARDPQVVGRLKLVRSRGLNKWSQEDNTLLLDELTKGTGRLKKGQITTLKVLSAPQALKVQGLKPAQLKKLQSFVIKGEGALAIVPISDPRTDAFPAMPFEATEEVASTQLSEPDYDWL